MSNNVLLSLGVLSEDSLKLFTFFIQIILENIRVLFSTELLKSTCFLPCFYHLTKRMIIYLWIPVSDYGLKWDLFKLFGKAFRGGQVSG